MQFKPYLIDPTIIVLVKDVRHKVVQCKLSLNFLLILIQSLVSLVCKVFQTKVDVIKI